MAGTDTASLVVALSAQLTKFEKDMKAAGIMADDAVGKIEKKFSSMNPQVNASFLGNLLSNLTTKGLDAATKAVGDLIDRFIDLQKSADYAGVSMQWLYGVQEAGRKAGASVDAITGAVKSLAFQLDEMKRGGDNALKTLLDANPKFLKGVNRDALEVEQTLRIVGNIIAAMPNQIQAVDVGKHLGIPPDAVQALRSGGDAFEKIANEAARAAPDLNKIYEYSKAIKELWSDFLKTVQDWASVNFFGTLKTDVADLVKILEVAARLFKGGPLDQATNSALDTMRGIEERLNRVKSAAENTAPKRVEITGGAVDPFARKAAVDDTTTALERQTDQIEKHILVMEAETAAAGKGVAEQERLRTEALLTAAAQRDGVQVTGEYAAALAQLAQRAGEARLAQAKAAEQIQKINQASQVFGSALSSAFADAIVEGKKLNEVLDSLIKTLLKAAINATIMNLFTPGAGGGLSPFAGLFKAAGGTDSAPGGMTLVGEQGPELVNLPRGAQVIPNDVLRSGMSGGAIVYSPAIDARGASVEAVARLAQIIEQDRAAFATRTVATIQQARRARVAGV